MTTRPRTATPPTIDIGKGVVTLVGQGLPVPADTVVDASGKRVMPGALQVHTHLDMPWGATRGARGRAGEGAIGATSSRHPTWRPTEVERPLRIRRSGGVV